MNPTSSVKLKDLLPTELPGMRDAVEQELRREPVAGGGKLAWEFIGSEATDAVREALDCDLFEILAQAWCKVRALHEYTDETRHPRDEKSVVHLGEHEFPTTIPIVLTAMIGPIPGPTLRFALELIAHFNSAALSIRGGHIIAIAAGDCLVSAQLKYGKVDLHDAAQSRKVTLPGRIRFDAPGLAIT